MKLIWLFTISLITNFAYANPPSIVLRYSGVFDRWCSQQNGIEITQLERTRLIAVFPELRTAWDNLGPILLNKTESIIKRNFQQTEMIATVFLCKKTPSMSMPLLINGNWFAKDSPQPSEYVVDIIFHELIHTYLVDNFPNLRSSPMLTKYQAEDPSVLSHLHLMAIQKKVYLGLGHNDRIEKVIKFDSEVLKGAYKRSWEIVNLEGEDKFLEELQ